MKQILLGTLVLAILTSFGFNIFFLQREQNRNSVTEVIDGDTFLIGTGDRIRLLDVNAPETGLCGSEEAKTFLSGLVNGKVVRISEEKRDTYGRRMGLVYAGNVFVNEEILKAGWARPDYTKNSQSERLRLASNQASKNKAGVYNLCTKSDDGPPDPECVIKGNTDRGTGAHYYHLPFCRHYKQIVMNLDLGDKWFCTEKEASAAGFRLAPDCLR